MKYTWAKALLFIPVWFSGCVVASIPVYIFYPALFDFTDKVVEKTILQLVLLAGTLVSFYFMRQIVGHKNLNFPKIKVDGFIAGSMIASIVITTSVITAISFRVIDLYLLDFKPVNITMGFLLFVFVAINEELLFRGGILQLLLKSYSKLFSLLFSSILFASVHLLNPGITWIGFLNITLSGIILGELYFRYKNIMPAVSLHLFWNFIQGPILGFAVSGQVVKAFLSVNVKAPFYLSGGSFGLEGSLITLFIQIIFALALLLGYPKKLDFPRLWSVRTQ